MTLFMDQNIDRVLSDAEAACGAEFAEIDRVEERNTARVLDAFQKREVALRHFAPTTGYGYDDTGRDTLDAIFADLFGTEAALVRSQFASGTHTLSACLFGLLRPGDHLLAATGTPYDTLLGVIGVGKGDAPACSLREMGVSYSEVALTPDGSIDLAAVRAAMRPETRLVAVQRSRGYAMRRAFLPEDFAPLSGMLRREFPRAALMVDNCYGEFVRENEPTHFGADLVAGSLIKNPGGGLAPTGGYVAGRRDLVERVAFRLTAPGIGGEVGSYAGSYRPFYQGLFLAPHTVAQALKTACLAARAFGALGFQPSPAAGEPRGDIIQALILGDADKLVAFCQGIQSASPVDSFALPEPWDMPGYDAPVVMAAGTFVAGASIELSADAPMRPPFAAYMQGGLTYAHGKIALRRALQKMMKQ